jgi:uncharacterized protein (DUF362 family)
MNKAMMQNRDYRIFLSALGDSYTEPVRQGLAFLDTHRIIQPSDTVFIKPNLTFPEFRAGVMTNLQCVESLVVALKDYTSKIIIGESDSGGYNPFDISLVQEKTGLKGLEKKYGITVLNLTKLPQRELVFEYRRREVKVPFPELLLDGADVLVSAAVPKIHMNTQVSMTLKNLWGCIPIPAARLRLHPFLERVLFEIAGRFNKTLAVIDGKYGLNRSGPMLGDAVRLDWLLLADNFYAADIACCHLMQVPPELVYYLRDAGSASYRPPALAQLVFNTDWTGFRKDKFYLKRAWTDYPGLLAFRSPFLSYLAYFSPFADILHKLLYIFRKPFYDYAHPNQR